MKISVTFKKISAISVMCLGLLGSVMVPSGAEAGCLSGALIGGTAGHFVGHHGFIGAAIGCAIGHHRAVEQRRSRLMYRDPHSIY